MSSEQRREQRLTQYEALFRQAFPDFAGTIPAWHYSYAER
jgi:hypothetical protein